MTALLARPGSPGRHVVHTGIPGVITSPARAAADGRHDDLIGVHRGLLRDLRVALAHRQEATP